MTVSRCSFRQEVVSDVMSGANVGHVGLDGPVKFGDLTQAVQEIYSSEAVVFGNFARFLDFDNCQPEGVSDVISGGADQDVGVYVCAKLGGSRLTPSEASFSAFFRTSITCDRKYIVTLYSV